MQAEVLQPKKRNRKRIFGLVALGVLAFLVVAQFIPAGRTNPPVKAEPNWDSPRTRELLKRACFDCHSNETVWPWYSKIAPISWGIVGDVKSGRSELNFSEWGSGEAEINEIIEVIREGEMPPFYYVWLHSEAKLSDAEKDELIAGLEATFGLGSGTGAGGD